MCVQFYDRWIKHQWNYKKNHLDNGKHGKLKSQYNFLKTNLQANIEQILEKMKTIVLKF